MPKLLRASLVLVALTAAPALACAHGHVGADRVFLNLGFLPFFGLGLSVNSHANPCGAAVQETQQVLVAPPPPPPQVVYVPTYLPPPLPVPPPPAPAVATNATPPRRERDDFAHLGVKWTPGLSAAVLWGGPPSLGASSFAQSVGLELRLAEWAALRSDLELRPGGTSWDALGLKLSGPDKVLAPYFSVSASGSVSTSQPGRVQVGLMGALGLDLKLGRYFFLEAEARYRVAPDACCRDVPQVTGTLGVGLAIL